MQTRYSEYTLIKKLLDRYAVFETPKDYELFMKGLMEILKV